MSRIERPFDEASTVAAYAGSAALAGERWSRYRDGRLVYHDTDDHVALILRTLGIDEAAWTATLDRYADRLGATPSVTERLAAITEAFRPASPRAAPMPASAPSACPACAKNEMRPLLARGGIEGRPLLVYGACAHCRHGLLLAGAAPSTIYENGDYYERRCLDGVGYDGYREEQEYRQAKGARLLDWIERATDLRSMTPSLLEVGSGFGFTLEAAKARGWRTTGIDINPAAARVTKKLYGLHTIVGTLGGALASGAIARGGWDLVLYQFVLEHLYGPEVELHHAAQAVAPGGHLALVVPNMSTFEVDVFGAAYRSFRADHLHLFSVRSLGSYLATAGFTEVAHRTTCSLHLLRGFLEPKELDDLYDRDRGPDLVFLARRSS
jgi:SAM-dependent methyltransferase